MDINLPDPQPAIPYASSADTRSRPAPKAALFLQSLVGGFLLVFGLVCLFAGTAIYVEGSRSDPTFSIVLASIFALVGLTLGSLGVLKVVYILRYRGKIRDHEERGTTFAEKMIRRW